MGQFQPAGRNVHTPDLEGILAVHHYLEWQHSWQLRSQNRPGSLEEEFLDLFVSSKKIP
jgi:hypothetical protein